MKNLLSVRLIVGLVAVSCVSCGDDPVLVEKREKQKAEISRMQGELELMESKLQNMPPDVSEELAAAEKKTEEQIAEIAGLEAELAELQARKHSIQVEFDGYRAKYQMK